LYDVAHRVILVHPPVALIIVLVLSGMLALLSTGFFGYADHLESDSIQILFTRPWTLYLWFSALIMLLQLALLRHASLLRQRVQPLAVTIPSIILVAVLGYFGPEVVGLLQQIFPNLNPRAVLAEAFGSPWSYTILNFSFIGLFWWRAVSFLLRQASAEASARRATPRSIAAYLVAAAMFMLVLSFFLHAEVIDFLSQLSQPGMSASRGFICNCSVSVH